MFRKYKEAVDGSAPPAESLDFEEFISFLDIEHYLGLRGSDTSSSEGNETQVAVKRYIGQVIWEATPRLKNIPPLYLEFARRLKGGDTVITFNYDTLLEESLDAVGQPYRLFRERFTQIGTLSCTTDMSLHEVVLLKPHGSVDWFNSGLYTEHVKLAEEFGNTIPNDPIFGPHRIVDPIPIVDGERQPIDPLKSIFRVPHPSALYDASYPLATPHILAPSYTKISYTSTH